MIGILFGAAAAAAPHVQRHTHKLAIQFWNSTPVQNLVGMGIEETIKRGVEIVKEVKAKH